MDVMGSKGLRVGYVRVSTVEQNLDRQLVGLDLDKIFEDKASAKDDQRPQLIACLDYVREGDTLVVHSIDRLARNLEDLQRIVRNLNRKGVSVHFQKENLCFEAEQANPLQNLMFQMMGAFAEFERSLIRERQREGIALAKKQGRPIGRPKTLSQDEQLAISDRVRNGERVSSVATEYGIGRHTVYRIIKEHSKQAGSQIQAP
jgi:DNA invertase Pin-like site-specific DNA recombinase